MTTTTTDTTQDWMEQVADCIATMRFTLAPETGAATTDEDMSLAMDLAPIAAATHSRLDGEQLRSYAKDVLESYVLDLMGRKSFVLYAARQCQ